MNVTQLIKAKARNLEGAMNTAEKKYPAEGKTRSFLIYETCTESFHLL